MILNSSGYRTILRFGKDPMHSERRRRERGQVTHDLYFTEAGKIGGYISIKEIVNEPLHSAWYAFQDSIESVRIMALLPQAVVSAAIEYLLPLTQAIYDVTGRPVLDDVDPEVDHVVIADQYSRIRESFFHTRRGVQANFGLNLTMYNKHNLVNSPLTRAGFFAILEAQILGVWSAFDTLTTDLCIAAVNFQPKLLYNLGQRELKLSQLLNHRKDSYDWTGRMGELLRLLVRFDSHSNTVDAYAQLFRHVPPVCEAIRQRALQVACLVRNHLTHDGGIVSSSFVSEAKEKGFKPWDDSIPGERLKLTGRNVFELCEGVIGCANQLVTAVDRCLSIPVVRAAKAR